MLSQLLLRDGTEFNSIEAIVSVFVTAISYDPLVLFMHRLLHTRRLFSFVHSKHHEMTTTVAYGGLFMHPLEHFLINIIPGSTGLLVLSHLGIAHHEATLIFLSIIGAWGACSSHCGFLSRHNEHHLTLGVPFSSFCLLD
jgi:sterol desaturase/sphingolipid hydroxylase (fatty acid hydroxylase superfamily)